MGTRNFFILVLLSVLFGGVSLIATGSVDNPLDPTTAMARYFIVGSSLIILIGMSPLADWSFHPRAVPLLGLWVLFGLSCIVSGAINDDLVPIKDGFWALTGVPIIFFNAVPKLIGKSGNSLIALALIIGLFPYFIISCISYPPSGEWLYRGVFANSNELGTAAFTTGLATLILYSESYGNKKYPYILRCILILLLVSIIAIVLLSQSRSSLLALFIIGILSLLKAIVDLLRQGPNILSKYLIYLTVSGLAIGFAKLLDLIDGDIFAFAANSVEALNNKSGFSGREIIWFKALQERSLFGHGSDYFLSYFGMGGHNTLIEILGITGMVSALLMCLFAILTIGYAFDYFRKLSGKSPCAIGPLLISIGFWMISMNEGMFGSLGNALTLAYLLSVGVVIAELQSRPIMACSDRSLLHLPEQLSLSPGKQDPKLESNQVLTLPGKEQLAFPAGKNVE